MENPYSPPTSDVAVGDELADAGLASRKHRFLAAMIDGLILLCILLPAFYFMGMWDSVKTGAEPSVGLTLMGGVVGLGTYLLVNGRLLARSGQTVGKRQMKIRIVSMAGEPVPLQKILLLRLLPFQLIALVPGVGNIVNLADALFVFRKDRRCLHDLAAGTKVVNC